MIQVKYKNQDKIVSLEEVIKKPSKFHIRDIIVKIDSNNKKDETVYEIGYNMLTITSFSKTDPQLNKIILEIVKNVEETTLGIYGPIITPELIKVLSENNNISKIKLTDPLEPEDEQYTLTKEDYELLKTSKTPKQVITPKISPELEEVFDPIISYNMNKPLILHYNYQDLQKEKKIMINKPLLPEEIYNLMYLPPNIKIILNIDDYQNLELILDRLLELNIKNEININIKDETLFKKTNIYLNNSKYSKLKIIVLKDEKILNDYSLSQYKTYEDLLDIFVKPAIDRNYSPFEKYVYAYNITKKFKKYKENEKNLYDSRELYSILTNEYMVCVGYSNLFRTLLEKLGIPTMEKTVTVTTNKPNQELQNEINLAGHSRVYSHIQDSKYKINGYYIADPTWDNNLEQDLYNHLALTDQEFDYSFRSSYIEPNSYKDILFASENKHDFYKRLERLIERNLSLKLSKSKRTPDSFYYKKTVYTSYLSTINDILNVIKVLDNKKYQEIVNKFYIPNKISNLDNKLHEFIFNIPKILEVLCDYILTKVNKPISGQAIIDAAMVINKDIFNLTEIQEQDMRENLIEINKKRQEICFPSKKIKNDKTGEITYQNIPNKFDFSNQLSNTYEK